MQRFRVGALALSATVLAGGCAQTTSLPPRLQGDEVTKADWAHSTTPSALYVVNSEAYSVTVYEIGSWALARALTAPQMRGPTAVVFDRSGNAYVANFGGGPSSIPSGIFVYRPGATLPYRTISKGIDLPIRLAFDLSGTLYVGNFGSKGRESVSIYASESDKPERTIYSGIINVISLAFDTRDYLYVTNHTGSVKDKGSVEVYPPGATEPSLSITQGIHNANQGILDRSDNLYVGNDDGGISVYPPGKATPAKIIQRHLPFIALAFDTKGNLYGLSRSLFVYHPGKSKPFRTIANRDPFSLAIDSDDDVFVGDNPRGCGKAGKRRRLACIRVFQHDSLASWYEVHDTDTPSALAFGPQ